VIFDPHFSSILNLAGVFSPAEGSRQQKMFKIIFLWCYLRAWRGGGGMRNSQDRKGKTRQRILTTAALLFNRKGLSETTIDEIMTAAGLTHGGFYRHFPSKDELYAEAVRQFLCKETPEPWQQRLNGACQADQPFARFVVDAYLSRDHLEDLDGSCPLIGLPSDVARSSNSVKAAYREVAESMIRVFESNLNEADARQHALVLVALCVGAMVLARAIDDHALGDDFRNAALRHAVATTSWGDGGGD
jgi:TetR/AcrR family transcriptional regulator, transcriptional repressor for nem operon